jgi:hypothetical protein
MSNDVYNTEHRAHPDYPGFTLVVKSHYDYDRWQPWEECDGHGPVREEHGARYSSPWTHGTGKRAGEVELCYEEGTSWFYDVQAALKQARREGWGLSPERDAAARLALVRSRMSLGTRNLMTHAELVALADCVVLTKGQRAAEAVRLDMEYLSGWLNNDWHWCGLTVTVALCPPEYRHLLEGQEEYEHALWGLESNARGHLDETALELGEAAIKAMQDQLQQESAEEAQRMAVVTRTRGCIKPVTVQELGVFIAVPDNAAVRADGWVQAWVLAPSVVELNEES